MIDKYCPKCAEEWCEDDEICLACGTKLKIVPPPYSNGIDGMTGVEFDRFFDEVIKVSPEFDISTYEAKFQRPDLFCNKCGRHYFAIDYETNCEDCGTELQIIPEPYGKYIMNDREYDTFVNEYARHLPTFDYNKYAARIQRIHQYIASEAKVKAIQSGTDKGNKYGITCPYCKATNIEKITTIQRMFSVGFFGGASGKLGKQWHCTHCNSDF